MEVKPIPADEVQSVTLPVDFYADLVVKVRTLELLETAMLCHVADDYRGEPQVNSTFIDAVQAIMPDTYEKMKAKLAENSEE